MQKIRGSFLILKKTATLYGSMSQCCVLPSDGVIRKRISSGKRSFSVITRNADVATYASRNHEIIASFSKMASASSKVDIELRIGD